MDCVSPEIQEAYHASSGQPPKLDLLLQLFEHVIKKDFETTYLIVDGLDESPHRLLLLKGLHQLCKGLDRTSSIWILLSSRPEHDIRQALSNIPSFSLEPQHVELDVETHVRAELTKMPKLCMIAVSTQEDLISDLLQRAEGMFRWVQCQLDSLRNIRTPQALSCALQALPAGLDETYDRILSSVREEDHEYVLRMLHWLVGSERPLSFNEVAEAIALAPGKDRLDPAERLVDPEDVFELCGSLIRAEHDETIVLAHFSVKEYLLSARLAGKEPHLTKFALQANRCRHHISMCMLSYVVAIGLRVQDLHEDVLDEEEFPLMSYVRHAEISHFQNFDGMRLWMNTHLFADSSKDPEWCSLLDYVKPPAQNVLNYGAAWFVQRILQCSLMCFWNGHMSGHNALTQDSDMLTPMKRVADMFLRLQKAWQSTANANDVSRYYTGVFATASPLCAAAAFNFEHVAQYLLENGALVDGISSLQFVGNPLLRALFNGHKAMVRILVECGARIDIRIPRRPHCTPLIAAASHSAEMVRYLIENYNVDMNLVDAYGRTIVGTNLSIPGITMF